MRRDEFNRRAETARKCRWMDGWIDDGIWIEMEDGSQWNHPLKGRVLADLKAGANYSRVREQISNWKPKTIKLSDERC